MSDSPHVAAVLGVGPGLGSSIARRFAREGYTVGLMARGLNNLSPVAQRLEDEGWSAAVLPTDAADPESVAQSFAELRERAGDPDVFVYNAGAFQHDSLLDITPEDFERCWKANCYGAFLGLREVLPAMVERGSGTIVLTGATASLRGSAKFANLAVGKFGLRALAQSAAREYGPKGVHVAHVIIDGQIATPRQKKAEPDRPKDTFLDPDAIADQYWRLHQQPRTVWTLELDLRPWVESF